MFSSTTKEAAAETARDAKNTMNNARRDVRVTTAEAKRDLAEIALIAGRSVRGYIDTAGEHLGDARTKVVKEVRAHPLRSSMIALGTGFLLGALFRR